MVVRLSFVGLLMMIVTAELRAADARPLPWKQEQLNEVPATQPATQFPVEGFKSFLYDGLSYEGHPTRVYAYYKTPGGQPPAGGWPAVICVHGGGGTAYTQWIQKWVDRGYAAIAMDLEGRLPDVSVRFDQRPRFDQSGPPRDGVFKDADKPIENQWFYHAVADVCRARSLLASFPEINQKQVGIHGISWGGIITSTVIGIDHRYAFAISVYGCGFVYEPDGVMHTAISRLSEAARATAIGKWDPSNYLPSANLPTFWISGTNDKHFPLSSWARSTALPKGPVTRRMQIDMPHGHGPGWSATELYDFADGVIGKGPQLPALDEIAVDGATVSVRVQSGGPIVSAELAFTTDDGPWVGRTWKMSPATIEGTSIHAVLPASAKAYFLSIKDDRGQIVTTNCIVGRDRQR